MIYGGKAVILVKCACRHNTSPVRSKIGAMVEGGNATISERLSLIATHNEFFFHLSLSDRFIIGSYAFNFQPKSPLFADETVCIARTIGI